MVFRGFLVFLSLIQKRQIRNHKIQRKHMLWKPSPFIAVSFFLLFFLTENKTLMTLYSSTALKTLCACCTRCTFPLCRLHFSLPFRYVTDMGYALWLQWPFCGIFIRTFEISSQQARDVEMTSNTRGLVDSKLVEAPSNFIADRPKAALLFWFFKVVFLSICLWYVSFVATSIAVHFAVCHALYNNKKQENR